MKAARIIHGVTNRYPMFYDRMFRTAIYQKAPSQIAMVLWKWVPVLGSQTSHRDCPRGYGFFGVRVQVSLSSVVVDTAKFKLVVEVPAVHAVVSSMFTVAEASLLSREPLPIGLA